MVLSGGGARGFAHVGVLKALEKHNIPIDFIVGTSIGGVIGGLFASGYSTADLERLVDTTDWNYILSLTQDSERRDLFLSQKQTADKKQLTIRFNGLNPIIPSAVSSGQRVTNFINALSLQSIYHPINNFDDLKIPFRCVATDLISGKMIVFSSGNISEALRASISVPLLYNPLKKDSLELTDGGLVSNIPVDVAKKLGADIIIAVNTVSPLRTSSQMNNPWEVTDQIVNIMAQEANKRSLDSATVVITPDLGNYSAVDFTRIEQAIEKGFAAAETKISEIQDALEHKKQEVLNTDSHLSNVAMIIHSLTIQSSFVDTVFFTTTLKSLHTGNIISISELREILGKFYAEGWYADVYAEVVMRDSTADITIHASLNPTLRSISIVGNSLIPSEEIMPFLDSLKTKPFNYPKLHSVFEDILTRYRNNGYSLARIQDVAFDSASGMLTVNINEGIIYKIYLKGKETTRDWVIWRELQFKEGDVFTVSKGKNTLANLFSTNLFDQVLIDVAYEDNFPVIIIQLEEKTSELSRMGLRIDNERSLQASLEFRNENLLGTATEIGLSGAGGVRNRKYVFDFKANRIFNTYFSFNFNGYYDLTDINTYENDPTEKSEIRFKRSKAGEYRQILYGVLFSFGQQVERLGTVNLDYKLEADEIKFISGRGYDPTQFTLQSLRLSSIIDSRDRYPYPRTGSQTNFSWETATSTFKGLVGDVGYSKIFFSYETNTSISNSTFRPKIIVGFGDQTLPLTHQFSLGGEDSFFGMKEDDERGRQIFLTSLEYRMLVPFKIIWDTYFKMRYDFGNIWPQREDIRIRDFHHGIGVGLSLDTPLGPANISIGRSFYIRRDLLDQPITLGPVESYLSLGFPLH
ncbi:MAG: patatin-like phospholipase family protein [Bacteroidota bacterium]|nr:patatin-like phospholipase family protein [Bacteroidota bacterium]